MPFKPLYDKVLIRPSNASTQTSGGIHIPDAAQEKSTRGTVVAAGPGTKDQPTTVKEGDVVLFGKYAGQDLQLEGVEHKLVSESEILGIVT